MTKESDTKRRKKVTSEKPVLLHPIPIDDALRALLVTPPPKEADKNKVTRNKSSSVHK